MVHFGLAPTVAFAFLTNNNNNINIPPRQQESPQGLSSHSSLISPYYNYHFDPDTLVESTSSSSGWGAATCDQATSSEEARVTAAFEGFQGGAQDSVRKEKESSKTTQLEDTKEEEAVNLEELGQRLGIQPKRRPSSNTNDNPQSFLIRLETNPKDDVRGVYLNEPVQRGDLILQIPFEACLLDDEPPLWWSLAKREASGGPENESFDSLAYRNPSDWASRLAATLLDLQFQKQDDKQEKEAEDKLPLLQGKQQWLSYLPNPQYLRASLPVHWPEDILSQARCTALELAVDSAYFARAEALGDLQYALKTYGPKAAQDLSTEELQRLCQNALDVVQTRSCRAEPLIMENADADDNRFVMVGETHLRLLAPVFDMINHGSSLSHGEGSANAKFGVEEDANGRPCLCVRATRTVDANDEVLIDYGDSAKPAWKCLLSYGFVPKYSMPGVDDEEEEDAVDENVAEVFLDGKRYECGPSSIPFEMVEAAMSMNFGPIGHDEEVELTPEIALKLAKRISSVSYYLLLDDKSRVDQTNDNEEATDDDSYDSVEDLISLQLAASLRWSQHRTLQACAMGLQDWASQ